MPTLRLLLNIGTADAKRLGLDKTTKAGATVDVDDEVADELLSRGWAAEGDATEPAPQALPTTSTTPRVGEADKTPQGAAAPGAARGAAASPAAQQSPPPAATDAELDAMTKEELQVYADTHAVPGVAISQHKDEMLKTIRKARK